MTKKVKAVLTISVHFEDETGAMTQEQVIEEAKRVLTDLSDHAANRGLVGSEVLSVETWDYEVIVSPK